MKRAWTKKVKSLPSGAIAGDALERQLQPHPKVKVRIFRTSAAMIGLTVSIGTPNLILTQAAPVPEGVSSANPIKDSAASKTIQNPPTIASYQVMPVEEITPQKATILPSYDRSIVRQVAAKKVAAPSYSQTNPVINPIAAQASLTPQLQPSTQIVAQAPVVKQDVRALLRQHRQTSLEQVQAVTPFVATVAPSKTSRLVARLKANRIEISRDRAVETAPTLQNEADSRTLAAQPEVAINPDANSAWTAKQRLLVERLKTSQNAAPLNNENALRVPSNVVELGQSPTTTSQPIELSAPAVVVPAPEQARSQQLAQEAPAVATTSNNSEFAAQPLAEEATVVPTTEPKVSQEKLATLLKESAGPSPATTLTPESSTQLQPVFVLPKAPIALEQKVDTPIEVEKVDEQQIASQNTPAVVENATLASEVVISVNEPIIVSSTTTEYQVKPGDTLTTIASAHRLTLPEIANFNHLPNPDLLLVDQRLKIPALTSMKTQANVAVLPPIEKVEPQVEANSLTAPTLQPVNKVALISSEQKPVQTLPASAYTGVGGSVSEAEAKVKPLEQTALNQLRSQYAQNLQNDVQKLQYKYYAQNPTVSAPVKSDRAVPATIKPSLNSGDEPINPDFRVAQTSQDLKPVPQKRLLNKVKYAVPTTVRGRVATAPTNADNSTEFATQQVTPELPPLAPALNYLPQPNNVPFNGYIWPARGALTSKYGWRWGRMHRGIDIAAPVGTPIFAAAPGVVIKSGWNKGGYGNLVDIQHADGTLTRYAHNYRLLVQPGQFVEQGQQISLMGNTGRSTGPHLHFEVHPGGKGAVNPIALLPKVR